MLAEGFMFAGLTQIQHFMNNIMQRNFPSS